MRRRASESKHRASESTSPPFHRHRLLAFVIVLTLLMRWVVWNSSTKEPYVNKVSKQTSAVPLKAVDLLQVIQNRSIPEQELPDLFPASEGVFAVYSQQHLLELRETLSREHVSICANGGSSTAGAKIGKEGRRYFQEFERRVVFEHHNSIQLIDRGHGSRNSFHSAQLAHSFFPEDMDVLIWEFAMNDVPRSMEGNGDDKVKIATEERNQLILWLQQVGRRPKPPLVIFVYLWKAPFTMHDGIVINPIFDDVNGLAAEYDFCVGHVNVPRFIEELEWGYNISKKYMIADQNHPSALLHRIIGKLLYDFVHLNHPETKYQIPATKTKYKWLCGNETKQQRLVQELIENHYSKASFTHELPQNSNMTEGMLKPIHEASSQIFGKQDPNRIDRQRGLSLPCCNGTLSFRVSAVLKGIQVNIVPRLEGLRVFMDDANVTDNLISAEENWDCLLSGSNANKMILFKNWVVLEESRKVETISFCTVNCNDPGRLALVSMAVY